MMFTYWPPIRHCLLCSSNNSSSTLRCAISLGDLPDQIFLQILDDQINYQSSSSTQSFPQYNKRIRKTTLMSGDIMGEEEKEIKRIEKSQRNVSTQTEIKIPFKIDNEELEDDEDCKLICEQIAQCLLDIAERWAASPKQKFGFFGWLRAKILGF